MQEYNENNMPKKLKVKNAKNLSRSSSYVSIVSWCQMNSPSPDEYWLLKDYLKGIIEFCLVNNITFY